MGVWGAGSPGAPASGRAVGSMKTIPGGGRSRLEPGIPGAACQRLERQDLPSPARIGEEPAKPPTARLETARELLGNVTTHEDDDPPEPACAIRKD